MPATAAASDERKTLHSHGAVARCSPKYSGTSRRTWRGHVGRLRDLPLSAPRPARAGALRQIALDERLKIQVPEGINLVALQTLNRRLSTPSRLTSDSNQLIVRSPLLRNDGGGSQPVNDLLTRMTLRTNVNSPYSFVQSGSPQSCHRSSGSLRSETHTLLRGRVNTCLQVLRFRSGSKEMSWTPSTNAVATNLIRQLAAASCAN
jgi:hypothetical protein